MFKANIDPEYRVYIGSRPKVKILKKLFEKARPQGMGILKYIMEDAPKVMTEEKALEVINSRGDDLCFELGEKPKSKLRNRFYFDYLFGRPLKVDISGSYFCSKMYNECNGDKAAEQAISELEEQASGSKVKF